MGVNIEADAEEKVIDCNKAGVLDHLETKKWAIRHSLEAVLTILRVDHIIMAKQAGQQQG
jgi:T-complex protein 1 subunit theta